MKSVKIESWFPATSRSPIDPNVHDEYSVLDAIALTMRNRHGEVSKC